MSLQRDDQDRSGDLRTAPRTTIPVGTPVGTPIGQIPPPPSHRERSRWWFVVGAITFAVIVVAGLLFWPKARDVPAPPPGEASGVPAPPLAVTKLQATRPAIGRVVLTWRVDPNGTRPERFRVERDGAQLAVLPARGGDSQLRYTDRNAVPGKTYVYSVLAVAGGGASAPEKVRIRIPVPPLGAARLSGSFDVKGLLAAESGFTNREVGDRFRETWTFRPLCKAGACATRASGPRPLPAGSWKMQLKRQGVRYTGTTQAGYSSSCLGLPVSDTIVVTLEVLRAKMVDGEWRATAWSGTFKDTSPYTSFGPLYCPSSYYMATIRGS